MIVDIVLIIVILLGAFIGYKRGLIDVVFSIVGIFLAIVLAMLSYKTVVKVVIPKTGLDKTVHAIVEQKYKNTEETIDSSINVPDALKQYFDANVIINQTSSSNIEKTTNFIVNAITIFILIIIYYIIITIIRLMLNVVAKLPVLNGINKIGGAVLGGVKNVIIVLILLTLLSFYSSIGKASYLTESVNKSVITQKIYNSNFLTKIMVNIQNTKEENKQ